MVEAHRQGTLPGVAGDLVTQGRTHLIPVTEIAERSGVPVERVLRVLLAAGIPATPQTEVSEELVRLMAAFEQGRALLGEDAVLAFTRVLGASAMNIAEAAVALFFAEFGPGTVREGPDELARARPLRSRHDGVHRRPRRHGPGRHGPVRALTATGPAGPCLGRRLPIRSEDDGPAEKVALGFVDLVGSTAWAETLSLRDQNLALTRFESAAWSSAVLAGGRVVKMIGDEVFFTAPTAEAACRIGTEVCRAADEDPGAAARPGGRGRGARHPERGRLLRTAREPAVAADQGRRSGRARRDRGGGQGVAAGAVAGRRARAGRPARRAGARPGLPGRAQGPVRAESEPPAPIG